MTFDHVLNGQLLDYSKNIVCGTINSLFVMFYCRKTCLYLCMSKRVKLTDQVTLEHFLNSFYVNITIVNPDFVIDLDVQPNSKHV